MVVRADVVDHAYNIVIPVDAESSSVLSGVHETIQSQPGVIKTAVVKVVRHIPYPPHDANGYITAAEAEVGVEPVSPGRQGASPGFNPFG